MAEELNKNNEESRAYTEEEVKELLQKETDKRVTEALKKQEKKFTEQ